MAHISKVKYLGYTFYSCKGISNAEREKKYQDYVRGWVEYFRLADMKTLLEKTDKWARRRIRAVYWKQWKKVRTK